jgi:hypothetical protein
LEDAKEGTVMSDTAIGFMIAAELAALFWAAAFMIAF